MEIDEAIKEVLGKGKIPPFVDPEATLLAIKALEFMRDHKCNARDDPGFVEWLRLEYKDRCGEIARSWRGDEHSRGAATAIHNTLLKLDRVYQPPTKPKLTGDYFGAEF